VTTRAPVLVLGVGSELRRDDAAGHHVVRAVAAAGLPAVEACSVHQLTPELAVALADRRLVVIADADVDVDTVRVTAVRPRSGSTGAMTHHLDPAALAGLATLFGEPPGELLVVSVPVHDLRLGNGLSTATLEAAEHAAAEVLDRCRAVMAQEPAGVQPTSEARRSSSNPSLQEPSSARS
jgi:hydrogenase maturation protease